MAGISSTTKTRLRSQPVSRRTQHQALVAITEVILEHGIVDDLVPQLVETVQRVMQVDNVAILLLDSTGQMLLMNRVRGPEEAVADKVRVPLGQGVAGRIAASGMPLVIPDLAKAGAVNPFLSEHLHSLLGVPLRVADRTLGVIHVSTVRKRNFTKNDTQLLQLVADRIALALDRLTMVEQAQRAQALAEERAGQLEATFGAMTDGVFVMDTAGRVLQCNEAGARLLKFREPLDYYKAPMLERTLGTTVLDQSGDPLPEVEWPFARILRGEVLSGPATVDMRLELHTGSTIVVNVSGAPVRDARGNIVAAVCICREVTERRAQEDQRQTTLDAMLAMAGMVVQREADAEEAARRLITLACDILSCTRAALLLVDSDTGLIRPYAVAGLSPDQEQEWFQTLSSQAISLAKLPDRAFVAAMEAGAVTTYDFTRAPHDQLPNPFGILTVLIAPLLVNERLAGLLTFDHGDTYYAFPPSERQLASAVAHLAGLIIERERLTQEQLTSEAHALALEETMSHMQRFLGITTHELRTPLTAIKANVQFVARGIARGVESGDMAEPLASQMQKAVDRLEMVDKQADQMNRFITDLLDTTRIQVGKLELHMSQQDVVAIVRAVVRLLQVTWRDRAITLEAPAGPLFVSGDPDRIGQVVTNLINNALKYSAVACPVRVEVEGQPEAARVAVIDQGPGLTAVQQQDLFDAFVQAEGIHEQAGPTTGKPGLGLGLFIARAIVTQHGGQIGVESVRGSGSTFWFTLPLEGTAGSPPAPEE